MNIAIPTALTQPGGAGSTAAGAAWLESVPALVERAAQRWQLQVGEPFGVGTASWTAPATTADGTPVVLKISFPHDEARYEAVALALWRGSAAVELLAHEADDWALLMRRAHPGTPLLATPGTPEERIEACLGVLANLHQAPIADVGVPILREVAQRWVAVASERATRWHGLLAQHTGIVTRGIDLLRAFAADTAAPTVLLHGDLNPGNLILDDPGTPHWLAIDPKPMLGDPAYELWPVLSQIDDPFEYPDPVAVLMPRLLTASQALALPARRAALWACARTVESVLWQLDTWPTPDRQSAAMAWLSEAQIWAGIADTLPPA
ncbi:aminoglycoside phosphotransferase family protein [Pseudactinotalea sp.]|uniref:aminoglycoside phosphotransferase family protein n=1 Tax=Pseudactinotalea sp. TaxID=1926260 RepID=UPI003B3BA8A9